MPDQLMQKLQTPYSDLFPSSGYFVRRLGEPHAYHATVSVCRMPLGRLVDLWGPLQDNC